MRQLAMAIAAYEAEHGSLPPAYIADADGKPMHSWRVLLLPYLGEKVLYDQYRFDEPWDSPNNMAVANTLSSQSFRCPSASNKGPTSITNYVAIIGPGTAWPDATGIKVSDVSDGAGATLLLVEWPESDIQWNEPRDLPVEMLPQVVNPALNVARGTHRHHGGVNAVHLDTSTAFLPSTTTPAELRAMTTIAGGEVGAD
jgi:hypothetical protein